MAKLGVAPRSRRFLLLALLSAGLALLVSVVEQSVAVPAGAKGVLALLPLIPLVAMFFGIARWIESLDELQRLIHLEAFVVQFGATGILVMGYGMLARSGVVPDLAASRLYPFLWLAIFGFWAVGLGIVRRKYE